MHLGCQLLGCWRFVRSKTGCLRVGSRATARRFVVGWRSRGGDGIGLITFPSATAQEQSVPPPPYIPYNAASIRLSQGP